jgi:hypothetical protein
MQRPVIDNTKRRPAAHGGGVRGDNSTPRSSLFEGRFGRMFRSLPAAEWSKEALEELGVAMTAEPEVSDTDPNLPIASKETADHIQDDEENAGISAGYTYLGQFIDHDITFDPASSLQQLNDPDALVDYRTPRLDLDSLYGRGPDDQPYMYDGKKFRLGRALTANGDATTGRDLPRYADINNPGGAKRALIGDKRNDENVIVSQLHAAMLQFHNRIADENPSWPFSDIQQEVRWHYQWIVVNDFLMKVCGEDVVRAILPHLGLDRPIWENRPRLAFYRFRHDAFMPIEFSVAAYRFGHSMVRPIYRLNTKLTGGADPDAATQDEINRGIAGRFFIFAGVQKRGLNGFDEFPDRWAIDWSLYFDIGGSGEKGGTERAQPAYKIDTSLVNPLRFLPEFSQDPIPAGSPLTVETLQGKPLDPAKHPRSPRNLALRNLLRGVAMGLPSGQDVACSMGIKPIDDDNLRVGKAVVEDWDKNKKIVDVHKSFEGKAPLWYYILAETQYEWMLRATGKDGRGDKEPLRLGSVGARIVAETLIGMLLADGSSYLAQAPNWKPDSIRTMGDLIKFALSK